MFRHLIIATSVFGAACASTSATADTLWPLTPGCETALALSASPVYVREGAGAYVLGAKGYEQVREASNNYVCLVERVSDGSLLPQCFDKLGQEVHVRVHLDDGRKMRAGISWKQIRAERAAAFEDGTYNPVEGHGVVYMASDHNYFVNLDGTQKLKIAPHVMYHAPNMTMEDMNSDQQGAAHNHGMPVIASQGPMGFMVSFVEKATDSFDVQTSCAGQLPDLDTFTPVPPRGTK